MRKITEGDRRNWYAKFDPVGTMGNVYFLIPHKTEWEASVTARKIANIIEQPIVTLRPLRGKR